jgi:biotin synthase-related radical SAM superfamily protein
MKSKIIIYCVLLIIGYLFIEVTTERKYRHLLVSQNAEIDSLSLLITKSTYYIDSLVSYNKQYQDSIDIVIDSISKEKIKIIYKYEKIHSNINESPDSASAYVSDKVSSYIIQ